MEWLTIAKGLAVGESTRTTCPCKESGSASRIVSRSAKGYSSYCFRCHSKNFESTGTLTLAELATLSTQKQSVQDSTIELPYDFTASIPLEGRQWLYSCGIVDEVWTKYNIGYSDSQKRVVIPMYNNGELVWYQSRALSKQITPKYRQPSADKSKIMFRSHNQSGNTVVVCEDIASAIRVGEVCPAVSILGTKLSSYQINQLGKFDRVILYLDSDKAGVDGAKKAKKQLGILTEVLYVSTELDPKCYTTEQLKQILGEKL